MTDHDLTRTPPAILRRARLMFVLVAFALPLLITAAAAAVILAWLPELPGTVVTHWGVAGADGLGPPSTYLWLLLALGLGVPFVSAAATLGAVGAHWGGAARLMGAFAGGMSAFAAAMAVGSLAIQRDVADVADAPGIGPVVAVSFASLLVVGVVAWFLQPRVIAAPGRTLEPRRAVEVQGGERVVWVATTSMPAPALAVIGVILVTLVVLAVSMLVAGIAGGWVAALCAVFVAGATTTVASFRVRVTPEGFFARSFSGLPRIAIPLDEIAAARAVDVSPLGEFGGWGWRFAVDGRSGIVLRRGAAIEVVRRRRRPFIVTIDGAEEAAALLQAYIDRSARSPRAGNGEHPS